VQLGYLPERDRSPLTALVLAALFIAAFGERIRGEEAALAKAFPEEWPGYVRETWRLVPGLF
jgi:protein-S-isoprenylcysteine O-methyltransferase Ste14